MMAHLAMLALCMVISLSSVLHLVQPGVANAAEKLAPDKDSSARFSQKDRRQEREKRLTLRTLEDLRFLRAQAATEQTDLTREIDAIAPLETIVRDEDLRAMSDLLDSYDDWLAENEAAADNNLTLLASRQAVADGHWPEYYATLANGFKQYEGRLAVMSEQFNNEGKRIATLVDRRRQLRATLEALYERQRRQSEHGGAADGHLRVKTDSIAAELAALPNVNEDALQHYFNVGERARAEATWMAAKAEEYAFLADTATILYNPQSTERGYLDTVITRLRRVTERVATRLSKRIDELDRKRERVQPAGTFQELQRSAELLDMYQAQKQRYRDYISRLKAQAAALEADLGELAVK